MSRIARNVALIAVLAVALAASGLLAFHAVNVGRRAHSSVEPVRPWMSVPYIAHSRNVPQSALWSALGIAPHPHDHRPISRIARDQRRSLSSVISSLESVLEHPPKPNDPRARH